MLLCAVTVDLDEIPNYHAIHGLPPPTHGKHAVYANPKKSVPLEPTAQPVAITIPKDGRLVPVAARVGGRLKTPEAQRVPADKPA